MTVTAIDVEKFIDTVEEDHRETYPSGDFILRKGWILSDGVSSVSIQRSTFHQCSPTTAEVWFPDEYEPKCYVRLEEIADRINELEAKIAQGLSIMPSILPVITQIKEG